MKHKCATYHGVFARKLNDRIVQTELGLAVRQDNIAKVSVMAIFVSRRSMILAGRVEVASSRCAIVLSNAVRVNMEAVRLVGV